MTWEVGSMRGVRRDPERLEVQMLLRHAPLRGARLLDAYVVIRGSDVEAGALVETPSYYADFVAGDRAVEQVIRKHLFALQAVEIFRLRWYFRTLAILEQTLAEDWTGTDLPASVRGRLTNVLNAHPNAQIAVTETFRLNVLRKR